MIYFAGIFVCGILCAILRVNSAYRIAAITLSIVLLITHGSPPWMVALHRFIEVSIGNRSSVTDFNRLESPARNLKPTSSKPSAVEAALPASAPPVASLRHCHSCVIATALCVPCSNHADPESPAVAQLIFIGIPGNDQFASLIALTLTADTTPSVIPLSPPDLITRMPTTAAITPGRSPIPNTAFETAIPADHLRRRTIQHRIRLRLRVTAIWFPATTAAG